MKILSPRKDCFAWDVETNKCKVLTSNECEYGRCSFFKTPSQAQKAREQSEEKNLKNK